MGICPQAKKKSTLTRDWGRESLLCFIAGKKVCVCVWKRDSVCVCMSVCVNFLKLSTTINGTCVSVCFSRVPNNFLYITFSAVKFPTTKISSFKVFLLSRRRLWCPMPFIPLCSLIPFDDLLLRDEQWIWRKRYFWKTFSWQ